MLAFDPNFDPLGLLLIALLNPVVIAVAWIMGARADQWQKLIVIGFASALAGAAAVWLTTFIGLLPPRQMGSDAGTVRVQHDLRLCDWSPGLHQAALHGVCLAQPGPLTRGGRLSQFYT